MEVRIADDFGTPSWDIDTELVASAAASVELRKDGRIGDVLLLLEHHRRSLLWAECQGKNILASPECLRSGAWKC